MKLTPKEQSNLTHWQKLFYSLYDELPVEDVYYRYNNAKREMYDTFMQEKQGLEISKQIEDAVVTAVEQMLPKELNLNVTI